MLVANANKAATVAAVARAFARPACAANVDARSRRLIKRPVHRALLSRRLRLGAAANVANASKAATVAAMAHAFARRAAAQFVAANRSIVLKRPSGPHACGPDGAFNWFDRYRPSLGRCFPKLIAGEIRVRINRDLN